MSSEEPASGTSTPPNGKSDKAPAFDGGDYPPTKMLNLRVITMGLLVSLGGFIFGWEGGSISGYTQMDNFRERFGDVEQSDGTLKLGNVRQGLLTGMLCVGCLVGSLVSGPISDRFGRKYSITFWNLVYLVGNIVCITTEYTWYQVVIGRLVDGFGIGALSVLTPMYQSETAPPKVRGALVAAYQLFITLGIFVAYCVNYGTESIPSTASWRITMGIGFVAPTIMGTGMLFMRESPRWEFRRGGEAEAAKTLALVAGSTENHPDVQSALRDIREQLEAEMAGGEAKWYEIFTAPAMFRRVLIGMALQALQQLTGANFFFYYGTEIFDAVGISNSYITSIILGIVNVVSTFGGLYVGQKFGRRISMIIGGLWMFMWLIIFASLGSFALYPDNNPNDANARTNSSAGSAMIASACLFIVGFAVTWGPLVWAIVGEMFPSRYRAVAMGLCTAANWLWNFLISFFTPWITGAINYRYGYVFAGCCFLGVLVTFFFVVESQGRTLEEVDSMYILGVVPWKSKSWSPLDDPVHTGNLHLAPGARDFAKPETPGAGHIDQTSNDGAGPSKAE